MRLLAHGLSLFCPTDGALVTGDGEVLYLRSKNPLNYATLGAAARSVIKYCRLNIGDVALLNDPSSGGVRLGDMTFVTKLHESAGTTLWLARRHTFQQHLVSGKTIEEEGVRIPPTPIYQGQLNEMILTAIQGHPLCPPDLRSGVEKMCADIQQNVAAFKRLTERHRIAWTKASVQAYIDRSGRWAHEKVQEASSGDARAEIYLDDREMIRLHLDIHDGQIKMDFGGTTQSKKRFLTEDATYGVCFEAIARFYRLHRHLNAGSFSVLQITKPSQCLLNARYPAPMNEGANSVKAALQSVIAVALAQIHTKSPQALCAFANMDVEIGKSSTEFKTLSLPGGAGGRPGGKETFLFSADQRFSPHFSVERWERQFPLRILRLDYRNNGRTSSSNGGHGLILKMQALEDLRLRWRTDLTEHRPKPVRNSLGGDSGQAQRQQGDQAVETLPAHGELTWAKDSVVTFSSGNGGGWTLPTKASESE